MQSRNQRIGLTIAGVLLIVGIIIATIGVLQIRDGSGSPHVASTATVTPTAVHATSSPTALPAGNDWTQYRYGVTRTGVNPEGSITTTNVAQLTVHWSNAHLQGQGYQPIESTPP